MCCNDNDHMTFTKDATFVGGGLEVYAGTRGNTRIMQVNHNSKLAVAYKKISYGDLPWGNVQILKEYDLSVDTPMDVTKQDRQCQLPSLVGDIDQMTGDDDFLYAYSGLTGETHFVRIKRPTTNDASKLCEVETFVEQTVVWGRRADLTIAEGYLVLYGKVVTKGMFMKLKISYLGTFRNGRTLYNPPVESKPTSNEIFSFYLSVGAMQSSGKYVWAMDSVNYNVLDVTKSWRSENAMMSMKPAFFQPKLKDRFHYLNGSLYDYQKDPSGLIHQTYHIASHNSFVSDPNVVPSGCSYSLATPIYYGGFDWWYSVVKTSDPNWSIMPKGSVVLLRVCPSSDDSFPTLDHCVLDKIPRWASHVNNAVVNDATNEFYFSGHTNIDYNSKEREEAWNTALNMTLKRHYRQGIAKAVANWETHVCELKFDKFPNPQVDTPIEPFTNDHLLNSNRMNQMRVDVLANNLHRHAYMADYKKPPSFGDTPLSWSEMSWASTTYGNYVYTWGRGNFRVYDTSTMNLVAHTLNVVDPTLTTPQIEKMYVGSCYDYKYMYQSMKCCEKPENTTLSLTTLNAHIKGSCENNYDKQIFTGSIIDTYYNKAGDCDTFIKRSAEWDIPLECNSTLRRNAEIITNSWMWGSRSINVAPGTDPNTMLWQVCPLSCSGCNGKYEAPPAPPPCPPNEYPVKITLLDSWGDGWGNYNDLLIRWGGENSNGGKDISFKSAKKQKIEYACFPSEDTCASFTYHAMGEWHTEVSYEISYPGQETIVVDGMQSFGDNQQPPKQLYGVYRVWYSPSQGLNCNGNEITCLVQSTYSTPLIPCNMS